MNNQTNEASRRLAITLAAILATLNAIDPQAAPSVKARWALDRFLQGLSTLSAAFEQRVFDETGDLLETSTGVVSIERPGKFAWEYREPYRQSIISDGRTLWLYDVDLAQVTINEVDATAAGSAAQLLGEVVDIDAQYDVVELGERDGADWLRLTPKVDGRQYAAVEIGMMGESLTGIRLLDNLGQTTALRFSKLQRNLALASSVFTFSAPADVDVVTGTGAD